MQFIILLEIAILLTSGFLYGHGINYRITSGKGVVIEASYDDGEPMAYSEVKIYPPDEEEIFQQGIMDRNGKFIFFPDTRGEWKIIVNDGMGHGFIKKIKITEKYQLKEKAYSIPVYQKIISGVGIIGLIFTIIYILLTRKKGENAHS